MQTLRNLTLIIFLMTTISAQAAFYEIGVSYNYMKRVFSPLDNIEGESTTGSVSFYAWERVAIELSYTNSIYIKREKESSLTSSTAQRTTTQYSDIYESNLIFVFADRKAVFQPYVKGGAAYIKKKQVASIDGTYSPAVEPTPGFAPAYGVGAKILISDSFAIKLSYDTVQTPVDDTNTANDINGRVGLTWMF